MRPRLTYANVMSTIAVIVAVAGGSTAVAVTVSASKKSDVNKKGNIRAGRVTATKLADGAVLAPKLGGIHLVQAGAVGNARANCPAGERLTGGGAASNGSGVLILSAPGPGENWDAAVNAASGVTAYALCLKATP